MNKPSISNNIISFILILLMLFSIAIVNPIAAEASTMYDVEVTKLKSFSKDGKYYMSFDISNTDSNNAIKVWAELYNSSGEKVFYWYNTEIGKDKSKKISFGTEYSHLKSGKYTFKLLYTYGIFQETAYYTYTIKNEKKESFAFKDYEKVKIQEEIVYKWNIQCTNLKDQSVIFKIYDTNGDMLVSIKGPKRKTNNEVGWFSWNGSITTANGDTLKCPSGTYLVQLTATESNKVVEQEFKLIIN
jgi:hypothetical protein